MVGSNSAIIIFLLGLFNWQWQVAHPKQCHGSYDCVYGGKLGLFLLGRLGHITYILFLFWKNITCIFIYLLALYCFTFHDFGSLLGVFSLKSLYDAWFVPFQLNCQYISTEIESKRSQVLHCWLGFGIYLATKFLWESTSNEQKLNPKGANWINVNQFGGPQIWYWYFRWNIWQYEDNPLCKLLISN